MKDKELKVDVYAWFIERNKDGKVEFMPSWLVEESMHQQVICLGVLLPKDNSGRIFAPTSLCCKSVLCDVVNHSHPQRKSLGKLVSTKYKIVETKDELITYKGTAQLYSKDYFKEIVWQLENDYGLFLFKLREGLYPISNIAQIGSMESLFILEPINKKELEDVCTRYHYALVGKMDGPDVSKKTQNVPSVEL